MQDTIIADFFSSTFYYIGAGVFNLLVSSSRGLTWKRGLVLRFNLVQLVDWGAERKLNHLDVYLEHAFQASQLLQANKSSLAHLDALCNSSSKLNSVQVGKLLRSYRPSEGEPSVSVELIACVRARAMANADVKALDDETVFCRYVSLSSPLGVRFLRPRHFAAFF